MTTVTASVDINASVERVFEVFSDLENAAERIAGIKSLEMLSEPPFAVGTRWRETRVMMGKESTEEMWVTEVTPPTGYVVEAESHGMHYRSTFEFTPIGDGGTRSTLTFTGTPQTLMAKIFGVLMGKMMMNSVKKLLCQDMQDLGKVCEQADQAS